MMGHLAEFARRVKFSGTAEELESFRYLQATLDGYGYHTELIQHDAYISLPGRARVEIGTEAPDCITHSFSRASAPGGTRGRVVYGGLGRAEDFAGLDARGRVVLLESIANPGASLRASEAGAIGQIHISPHEHLHEMCISPVWGSPTDETLGRLPRTVVLSLRKADGDALKQRVQAGEEVEVEVDTGWRTTPLLVAELPGPRGGSRRAVRDVLRAPRHLVLRSHGQRWRERHHAGDRPAVRARAGSVAARAAAVLLVRPFARPVFGLDLVRRQSLGAVGPTLRGARQCRLDRGAGQHGDVGCACLGGTQRAGRGGRAGPGGQELDGLRMSREVDPIGWTGIGVT
jgi:hypothetical protein